MFQDTNVISDAGFVFSVKIYPRIRSQYAIILLFSGGTATWEIDFAVVDVSERSARLDFDERVFLNFCQRTKLCWTSSYVQMWNHNCKDWKLGEHYKIQTAKKASIHLH